MWADGKYHDSVTWRKWKGSFWKRKTFQVYLQNKESTRYENALFDLAVDVQTL